MGKSISELYGEIHALEKEMNTLETKQKNVKKKIKKTLCDEFISHTFKCWQNSCCLAIVERDYWNFIISTYPKDILEKLHITLAEEDLSLIGYFQFVLDTIIEKAKKKNWTFEEYYDGNRRYGVFISF